MDVINSDELKQGNELKHMARMPYGNNSHPLKKCSKNTKGLVGAISSIIKTGFVFFLSNVRDRHDHRGGKEREENLNYRSAFNIRGIRFLN